jgi:glucose/arabinose dehydrogenase
MALWFALGFCAAAQAAVDFVAPPPAKGFAAPPLPEGPLYYPTGEGHEIKVVVVARGLSFPYSIAFLPDGAMLVSEKNAGRLRVVRNGVLDPRPANGIPKVIANNFSGLLDIELHPEFDSNQLIYFSYNKALDEGTAVAVARGRWDGRDLQDVKDIYVTAPGTTAGSRIAFGADGRLYVTIFGAFGNVPQQGDVVDGKVLRLTADGQIPPDNPFVGKAGFKPEIYSMGHRSATGLALHERTGQLWELEMGPNGGDEVNILKPGANYGWPLVSTGRNYAGPYQTKAFNNVEGMEDPVIYWMPSISVSGIAFYRGDKFPAWQNSLFVGGMRTGEIAGTGRLERIHLNADMQEIRRETLLADLRRRIREVAVSPDGYIYVLTDEADGALLRIEPSDRQTEKR